MPEYRVVIKASAARELEMVGNKTDRRRLVDRIAALAGDPRPQGSEKLSGQIGLYRVRSGNYRVIYEVEDLVIQVTVIKVGHRKDIYRKI